MAARAVIPGAVLAATCGRAGRLVAHVRRRQASKERRAREQGKVRCKLIQKLSDPAEEQRRWVHMAWDGQPCWGHINAQGALQWSDGDVWTRG